jgi:hypothetical protein
MPSILGGSRRFFVQRRSWQQGEVDDELDCFTDDVLGSGAELLGESAWLDDDHGDGATARCWW